MRESGWLGRNALGVVFSIAMALTVTACGQAGSLATGPQEIELASKPAAIDISGTWSWSEEGKGLIPEELAVVLFDIEPEGRATHFTCHDEGNFTIVQDGASFTGISTQTGTCVTKGG